MNQFKEKTFVCKMCGSVFTACAMTAKYCPSCRPKARINQQRIARQNNKLRKRQVKNKKQTIHEISAKANAAGMSYGKYVAMLEHRNGEKRYGNMEKQSN